MAYRLLKSKRNGHRYDWKLFICDDTDDIALLPTNEKDGAKQVGDTVSDERCCIGSVAKVLEDSGSYQLGASGWSYVEQDDGDSGDTFNAVPISDAEIDALFD